MLKNYLSIAIRIINKNWLFSAINIIGLAIGLAASIIIYLWVYDEVSYDKFHEKANRIYRVERDMTLDGDRMYVPITSPPVGPQMYADYSSVESFVRYAYDDVMVLDLNHNLSKERLFYADSTFFSIFSFEVIRGNALDCLKEPFSLAISESYAKKYFGELPEIGSILNVNHSGQNKPYTITAIYKDFPHNSHIKASIIGSFSSLYSIRHPMMMSSWMASNHYTYVLLAEGTDVNLFKEDLQNMVDKYFGPDFKKFLNIDNIRDFLTLELMPISKIHLNANRVWELEPPGSKTSVLTFSFVSLLLLIVACINFMNLSTARASRRALEVGVRKVAGATKGQLVRQFLGESIIYTLLATILAILLIELALPSFSNFTGKSISTFTLIQGWNLPLLVLVWIITAIVAGAYPALFISKYKPVYVLKGAKSNNGSRLLRRILVVGQFAISIGLVICAISVYRQLDYINTKDLGYNRYGLIDIPIENRENFKSFEPFKNDLLKISGVTNVTRSMVIPTNRSYSDNPHVIRGNPEIYFPVFNRVDHNFIPTFKISMAAGNNFTSEMVKDTSSYYILNDAARIMFGFETPIDALGQDIGIMAGKDGEIVFWGQIVGVCNNFHFQPLTEQIKPMVLNTSQVGHNHITIRVDNADISRVNNVIAEVWSNHYPNQVYSSTIVSEQFKAHHTSERRLQLILLIFTFLSIFVASLGLLGLSTFTVEQRLKEIGIRKTLGAGTYQIISLIVKEYSITILVSSLIATPIAFFTLKGWLNNFPYRRDMEIWVFVASVILGWLVAFLTVFVQTYRASLVNPTQTLKNE